MKPTMGDQLNILRAQMNFSDDNYANGNQNVRVVPNIDNYNNADGTSADALNTLNSLKKDKKDLQSYLDAHRGFLADNIIAVSQKRGSMVNVTIEQDRIKKAEADMIILDNSIKTTQDLYNSLSKAEGDLAAAKAAAEAAITPEQRERARQDLVKKEAAAQEAKTAIETTKIQTEAGVKKTKTMLFAGIALVAIVGAILIFRR